MCGDAVLGEEHVLGAAQADAFGAELAGRLGVARDIGIGAHAELAAELVGPVHEGLPGRRRTGRRPSVLALPAKTSPVEPSSDSQSPSFSVRVLPPTVTPTSFLCSLTVMRLGAGHAGGAHAAADHRRVAGHAAARGEDALGHFHAVDVVRHGFFADQDDGRRLRPISTASSAVNTMVPTAAPGEAGSPVASLASDFLRRRIEHRVQQLIELLRIDAQDGFLLGDQAFVHHLDGDANRRRTGALAVAGLQHVELAVLDGELEVLDVAVVLLEHGGDLAELVVDRGIPRSQVGDGLRRADAGHHVFALRVLEELAVEGLLAGGRVAGEAHAGGRGFAHVAEHHGLHVDGGAEVVGNLVHLAVVDGAGVEPGAEHGVARALKLRQGILRERLAGLLLDQLLVARDDLLQVFGGQVGIELGLGLLLLAVEDVVEIVPWRFPAPRCRTSG